MPSALNDCVQRAAAFVAARARGDLEAAEVMLASFVSETQRTLAFAALAEVAIGMLAVYDAEPTDAVATRLALSIAQARDAG